MNYLEMANEVLNYAANKSEYTVQTYFNGPEVTVKDSNGHKIFHYEKRGERFEEMKFEYNGKLFNYVRQEKRMTYWTKDTKTGALADTNEDEFFDNEQEFADEMGGDMFWMN